MFPGVILGEVGSVAGVILGEVGSFAGVILGKVSSVAGVILGNVGSVAGVILGEAGSICWCDPGGGWNSYCVPELPVVICPQDCHCFRVTQILALPATVQWNQKCSQPS